MFLKLPSSVTLTERQNEVLNFSAQIEFAESEVVLGNMLDDGSLELKGRNRVMRIAPRGTWVVTGYPRKPSLQDPLAKLERADEHLLALTEIWERTFGTGGRPFTLRRVQEVDLRNRIWDVYLASPLGAPPPARLSLIAGDMINNTRCALVALVTNLLRLNGQDVSHNHAFPIWTSAPTNSVQEKSFDKKIKGLPPDVAERIKSWQPFALDQRDADGNRRSGRWWRVSALRR